MATQKKVLAIRLLTSASGPTTDIGHGGVFKSSRPSTTLADLFTLFVFANLSFAMWASLKPWSNDEFDDGVAYGRQAWLRRRPVDSFFSVPLVRVGGAGGMRKRSWS